MTSDVSIEEHLDIEIGGDADIDLSVEKEEDINLSISEEIVDGTEDYRILKNKPTINGERLVDNYNEIDPTVPGWAKDSFKPKYTADEVGALDSESEVSFSDIKAVWDSVFNS